jgi:hypothetical protein
MSALSIQVPFPVFQDRDGQPLDNGYVWLGTANLNPQTNPVVAYYDAALTIVAAQPLRTLNGYISRAGAPAQVYVDGVNFSILVQDSKGSMVYNFPDGSGISPNASGIVYDPAGTGAVATTVQAKLRESVSVLDFKNAAAIAGDWTTAIQAAIDAASSIFIPPGTYPFAGAIQLRGQKYIYGAGTNISNLSATTSNATLQCIVRHDNIRLENFSLDGNGVALKGIVLGVAGGAVGAASSADLLSKINVGGFLTVGVEIQYVQYFIAESCYISGTLNGYGLLLDSSGNASMTGLTLSSNKTGAFIGSKNAGFNASSNIKISGLQFFGPYPLGASPDGYLVIQNAFNIFVDKTAFEDEQTHTLPLVQVLSTNSVATTNVFFTECVWLGTGYAQDLISTGATGVNRVFFEKCRAIAPSGGYYILKNNNASAEIVINDCFTGVGYSSFGTFYWSTSLTSGPVFENRSINNSLAFSVTASSASTTFASGVSTKVVLDTIEFDSSNSFDAVTNHRFKPTVPGYYQINGGITFQTATGVTIAQVYKDGVRYRDGNWITSSGAQSHSVCSTLVYLDGVSNYIELYGYNGNASSIVNVGGNLYSTFLNGNLIK